MTQAVARANRPHEPSGTVFVKASQRDNALLIQLAASFNASVMGALTTTPFDVVKTRLQLLSPSAAMARCSSAGSAPFAGRCNQMQLFQLCACNGQVGGVVSSNVSRPSSVALMQNMVRNEGIASLWRGTGIAIVTAFPSVGIYLTMYDQLKAKLVHVMNKDTMPLVAGGSARAVAVVLTNPLEVIRTRIMAERGSQGSSGWFAVTRTALHNDGFMALWRGLVPTLYRDVPFSALYWLLAEATRTRATILLSHRQKLHDIADIGQARGGEETVGQVIGVNLLAGVVGGSCASVITHPFDVIKTRAQVGRKRPGATMVALREMVSSEGWTSLWRGVGPRVLKIGPSCAIVLASYEFFKKRWA